MLPDDAPVDFIPKRLAPIVMDGGLPSRPALECALMLKLQEELKSGNISVGNSKRFGRFDDYFLPQEQWGVPTGDLLSTLRVAVRSQRGGGLSESAAEPGVRSLSPDRAGQQLCQRGRGRMVPFGRYP